MKRRYILLAGVICLSLAGFAGYESISVQRQMRELLGLRERHAQLAAEARALRRERNATAIDLTEAERQLAALPPARTERPAMAPERRAQMSAWLARVKQLRRLFDEHPEQNIPEMRFLNEENWLRAARNVDFNSDDEIRRACAAIRDIAVSNFLPQITSALRKFADSAPAENPPITALQSLFDPPIDSNLLERYELTKSNEGGPQWRVELKAPIDADNDTRYYVSVQIDGRGSSSGTSGAPMAWIPGIREQTERAFRAYTAANNGAPPRQLVDVFPYFNPPLSPTVIERLLKADRAPRR